ncbi:hypothetical protein [Archangium sp.]
MGSHRQPLWPKGWIGSITHSNGWKMSWRSRCRRRSSTSRKLWCWEGR